jgi:hypothetical protein
LERFVFSTRQAREGCPLKYSSYSSSSCAVGARDLVLARGVINIKHKVRNQRCLPPRKNAFTHRVWDSVRDSCELLRFTFSLERLLSPFVFVSLSQYPLKLRLVQSNLLVVCVIDRLYLAIDDFRFRECFIFVRYYSFATENQVC